jgi:hypothetical protein
VLVGGTADYREWWGVRQVDVLAPGAIEWVGVGAIAERQWEPAALPLPLEEAILVFGGGSEGFEIVATSVARASSPDTLDASTEVVTPDGFPVEAMSWTTLAGGHLLVAGGEVQRSPSPRAWLVGECR